MPTDYCGDVDKKFTTKIKYIPSSKKIEAFSNFVLPLEVKPNYMHEYSYTTEKNSENYNVEKLPEIFSKLELSK